MGPVESITEALSLIGSINEDPVTFYNDLYAMLKEEGMLPETKEELEEPVVTPPVGEIPAEFKALFDTMRTELDEVKAFSQESKAAKEDASNKELLDNVLKQMHTDHGDFDDSFIIAQFAAELNPQQAIDKWKALESKWKGNATPAKTPPPKTFTGASGATPQEQGKPTFKNDAERKAYVIQALQSAATGD